MSKIECSVYYPLQEKASKSFQYGFWHKYHIKGSKDHKAYCKHYIVFGKRVDSSKCVLDLYAWDECTHPDPETMKGCKKDAIATVRHLELQTLPELDKGNLNLQNAVFKYLEAPHSTTCYL